MERAYMLQDRSLILPKNTCDAEADLCPVCGDAVSGYHYGLLTCESCKGFFKRTVQNNKIYNCVESQDCRIDKIQRKRCPFCRFQKCLRVGMRLEAVRADRMRGGRNRFGPMYKRHRALKQQTYDLLQSIKVDSQTPNVISSLTKTPLNFLNFTTSPFTTPCTTTTTFDLHQQTLCSSSSSSSSLVQPQTRNESPHHYHVSPLGVLYSQVPSMMAVGDCPGFSEQTNAFGSFSPQGSAWPPLLVEFLSCELDDLQVQSKITGYLQQMQVEGEFGGQDESLVYLMVDQMLFYIVEWARGSILFKELKVTDQMTLIHHCWCDLLALDIVSRQVLHGRHGTLVLATGKEVDLPEAAPPVGPLLRSLVQNGQLLVEVFRKLQVDRNEMILFKFLILFNTDVKDVENPSFVEHAKDQVHRALLDYTLLSYPQSLNKFNQLLLCLSDMRAVSMLAEEYLCSKEMCGEVPCNILLNELLHAKHCSV